MSGNEDPVDFWLTPPDLMARLQSEFRFDFDPCPYPREAGWDGLKEDWPGERIWLNPPFIKGTSLSKWVKRGIEESRKGKTIVIILPIPAWIEYLMDAGAEFRYMGRVRWCRPDGTQTPRPRFPSAIFVLKPYKSKDGLEAWPELRPWRRTE